MKDFYKELKEFKDNNNLTYSDLGKMISVSGDTFRMAMNRKTFTDVRKDKLISIIRNEQGEHGVNGNLYFTKDNVKISLDEIMSWMIINIKSIDKTGKLEDLISAINTVKNIEDYNKLSSEISKIKELLDRNKNILK